MVEVAECATLVSAEPEEISLKSGLKLNIRPLYIKAHVNGKPINRILIDGEAVLNIIPYSMVKKLGKSRKDLKETNMTMFNFTGGSTPILGFLIAELIVGSRTTNTVFFVVDAKPGYTILLGREWIYANQCVPSTLYQQL